MSDTIEIDGKEYTEIGHLVMANKIAKHLHEAIDFLHQKVGELNKENEELRGLLEFAMDELRYEIPEPAEGSDYDYCCVCMRPDWNHKEDCEAVQWVKDAQSALG
jgi:hypothetical protein